MSTVRAQGWRWHLDYSQRKRDQNKAKFHPWHFVIRLHLGGKSICLGKRETGSWSLWSENRPFPRLHDTEIIWWDFDTPSIAKICKRAKGCMNSASGPAGLDRFTVYLRKREQSHPFEFRLKIEQNCTHLTQSQFVRRIFAVRHPTRLHTCAFTSTYL